MDDGSKKQRMKTIKQFKDDVSNIRDQKLKKVDTLLERTQKYLEEQDNFYKANSSKIYLDHKSEKALGLATRDQILRNIQRNYDTFKLNLKSKKHIKPRGMVSQSTTKVTHPGGKLSTNRFAQSGLNLVNSSAKKRMDTHSSKSRVRHSRLKSGSKRTFFGSKMERPSKVEALQPVTITEVAFITSPQKNRERRNTIEYLSKDEHIGFRKKKNEDVEEKEATLKDLLFPLLSDKQDTLSKKMYEVYTEKYEDKILDLNVKECIRRRLMNEIQLEFSSKNISAPNQSKKDLIGMVGGQSLPVIKKKVKQKPRERGKMSHKKFEKLKAKIIPEESQKQIEKSKQPPT